MKRLIEKIVFSGLVMAWRLATCPTSRSPVLVKPTTEGVVRLASSMGRFQPMLPFKLVYSDGYYLPIGAHVFPAQKYRYIHQRLLETGVAEPSDFLEPSPASDEDVLLVHTPEYVHKLKTG